MFSGGELVVARRDDRGEVLLEELRVLAQRRVRVLEDDALLLQVLTDLVVDHLGLVLGRDPADQPLLLGLGDAQLVVGVLDVGGQVIPGRRLLLGGPDEVLDVLEVDAGQVCPPVRHGLAVEQLQALQPQVEHPLGLVLLARDVADDLFGQAAAGGRARHVRVSPAELVSVKALKLGVCGCGHTEIASDLRCGYGLVRVVRSVGAVMCVVQIPSPCAMVASRCTGVPRSRANASVSASHSWGNSAATCATGQ